jgi:hypothetical protein
MANWKIHIAPYPGSNAVLYQFEERWAALGAPEEFALFERTSEDRDNHAYLLTPAAGAAFPNLGLVTWEDADPTDLEMAGWGLGIGRANAKEWFHLP